MATLDLAADHTIDGELAVGAGLTYDLRADHRIDAELAITIPPLEGRKRVVLVDAFGASLGDLDAAVVGEVRYVLNSWERWTFTLPVDDPKAHLVLDEKLREVQLWRGDQLLSWGPMTRPQVDDTTVTVQVAGARWHLGRRHVGKASRENHLVNPQFEQGLAGWHFLKGKYFLSYAALADGDARIYAPGMGGAGSRALELNMDLKPWATPAPALSADSYTVVGGDTLWGIAAAHYGSGTEWHRIYDANQAQIQADAVAAGLWNPQDPGHWIFPGQVFTLPGVPADQAKVAPDDNATRWGDVFAFQDLTVITDERPLTVTLAGWIKVRGDLLEGWNPNRAGVMLVRLPTGYRTDNYWDTADNTWSGYRGLYTEVIEEQHSQLDRGHPRGRWIRHEISIVVPADTTEIVHARLCSVEGRCYWDNASLTIDTAFEAHDEDQADIVAALVEHAQDPAFDKNDVNITTHHPNTGVARTLVALHSEHGNIWQLASEYTRLRDGLDIGMSYTPTERIVTTHYPRKGRERRALHLQPGRNLASFLWTFDGEAAASSVVVLGTGDGSDREEASAIDTTTFADGLVLETIVTVGPDTPVNLLDEIADEELAVLRDPEVLTVTTFPHDPDQPHRNLIGRLWEGDTVPVTIRKGRVLDPITDEVVAHQFEVNGDYRVVELAILQNDALQLTLNRRAPA